MALNIVYPTAFELYEITSDLATRANANRLGLQLFPETNKDKFEVRWWQKDNAYGLMAMRGVDGRPNYVERIGLNQFVHKPGVYGEYTTVTEGEMLQRANPENLNQTLNVQDYVMDSTRLLTNRMQDRKEANIWTLLTTGTLSINLPGPNGPVAYSVTFPLQTYTAAISWATLSTATPLLNIQALQQLSVGHGATFGPGSWIYVNQVTANNLINNANAADFSGKRNMYGATINDLGAISNYFNNQGLPGIKVYDEGYQNQIVSGPITSPSTQFTKFIPDNRGVLIGKRPNNEPVGHVHLCPSLNNPNNAPGPYTYVKNFGIGENAPKETPARLEIHNGWSGGLAIEYPSAVVSLVL